VLVQLGESPSCTAAPSKAESTHKAFFYGKSQYTGWQEGSEPSLSFLSKDMQPVNVVVLVSLERGGGNPSSCGNSGQG
jgi:hypothetical protein